MNIELMAKQKGLPTEFATRAFTLAVETALRDHFDLNNIHVDLEEKIVEIVFRIPVDMDFREALLFNEAVLHADPLSVVFDMKSFPPKLVNRIRNLFIQILMEMEDDQKYSEWRKKTRRLVDGVITEYTDGQYIEVKLDGGQIGYFHQREWVPKEKHLYRPGKTFKFFITKVEKKPFKIYLSRVSMALPALMLKHQLPWNKFICKKRWIGKKSFIFTDAVMDKKFNEIRDNVRQQLNGEVLEIRSLRQMEEKKAA